MRPTKVDGQPRMMTMDFREDRINVEVEEGKVVKILNNS